MCMAFRQDRKTPGRHAGTAPPVLGHYSDFSLVTFVSSSATPTINPLFVSTNASTGAVAVVVSMFPFAPTFRSWTC
jgi:hypothetical protein